jgi:hypothetical protein
MRYSSLAAGGQVPSRGEDRKAPRTVYPSWSKRRQTAVPTKPLAPVTRQTRVRTWDPWARSRGTSQLRADMGLTPLPGLVAHWCRVCGKGAMNDGVSVDTYPAFHGVSEHSGSLRIGFMPGLSLTPKVGPGSRD